MENCMISTSVCTLRLFLELINCHEPGLLKIIKSFIFVYTKRFNNYNYISQCYFNKSLRIDENTIINWLFYISNECDIKEQISIFHRYTNGNLKSMFLKACRKTIEEEETHNKLLDDIELTKIRNLIGIYHIITTYQIIKDIDFMYIYNITLQTRRIQHTLNNTDYLKTNGIYETSTEYPNYTKSLKHSLTKTRNTIDEIIAKIENTEVLYSNYEKEIIKHIEQDLKTMLM
uniref:Uncharacterized protein n=1 Tax=viral metagenome TaxID=1070528 RepID=A0A6C0EGR9_9ZZZZ